MKHRFFTFALIIALIAAVTAPSFAGTSSEISQKIERYADGSYAEIITTVEMPQAFILSTDKTKTASTVYTYKNSDGKALWTFTLKGTFTYNGSTAKANSASTSYTIYDDAWKCSSRDSWTTGATAKGTATFKRISSKSVELGLKCSADGTITAV